MKQLFLQGFQQLSATIASLVPKPVADPGPSEPRANTGGPSQISSHSEPDDRISIYPSDNLSSDSDNRQRPPPCGNTLSSGAHKGQLAVQEHHRDCSLPGPPSAASSEDESTMSQNLSASDQRLWALMKDMTRILNIPSTDDPSPEPGSRPSFKTRTGPIDARDKDFPIFPIDRCCSDRIKTLTAVKRWRPFAARDIRPFRVPRPDFDEFLAVPTMSDTVRDKIAADSTGRTSQRSPFTNRERNKIEDTLVKVDTAAKAGLRLSCFLQLLSEFLVCACETDSPVSPDSTELAFHFFFGQLPPHLHGPVHPYFITLHCSA